MKAAPFLDAGGYTEYEKEMYRKRQRLIKAATPTALSTFSVPTTALIKAGMFGKRKKQKAPTQGIGGSEMTPGLGSPVLALILAATSGAGIGAVAPTPTVQTIPQSLPAPVIETTTLTVVPEPIPGRQWGQVEVRPIPGTIRGIEVLPPGFQGSR